MEQPAGRKRRTGGRSAVNRIPEETVVHKDSRWDIPRKRALFTSDRPDSMTFGSDIPESHADRPPEVEYAEILISRRSQDKGGTTVAQTRHFIKHLLHDFTKHLLHDFTICSTILQFAPRF